MHPPWETREKHSYHGLAANAKRRTHVDGQMSEMTQEQFTPKEGEKKKVSGPHNRNSERTQNIMGDLSAIRDRYVEIFGMTYDDTFFVSDYLKHIIPWTGVLVYVLMLLFLPRIMAGRGLGSKLKYVGFLWNMSLCVLSGCMLFGVAVPYALRVVEDGFFSTLCDSDAITFHYSPTITFWGYVFALSKFVELGDTFLLILKKPERFPKFLHWYHHLTVLLFTWYAEMYKFSAGHYFIIMNSAIHLFMYWYYSWAELGYRAWWAKFLTTGQIVQMVFGIVINSIWMWGYFAGKNCLCTHPTVVISSCFFIYASYFILFVRLYLEKYDPKAAKSSADKKKRKSQKIE